jgi:hypothetical protein
MKKIGLANSGIIYRIQIRFCSLGKIYLLGGAQIHRHASKWKYGPMADSVIDMT